MVNFFAGKNPKLDSINAIVQVNLKKTCTEESSSGGFRVWTGRFGNSG